MLKHLIVGVSFLSLTACGGGGDSGGGDILTDVGQSGGGGSNQQTFSSQELSVSTGLDQIRAAQGFARITGALGGAGTTIAIIDDGLDENHPEIVPNLVASFLINDAANGSGSHGTAVASVAAGATNNGGIMGVAYNAGIVGFQAGDVNPNDPSEIILDTDAVVTSINAASGGNARGTSDILNMSLGFNLSGPIALDNGNVLAAQPNSGSQAIEGALRRAAANGKLVVVSTGNDFNDRQDFEDSQGLPRDSVVDVGASFPAQSARDPGLANAMIAVMAVDGNNNRASFSNSCRGVENRCLAAPGTGFRVAVPGGGISDPVVNGTSYSAPLVSGAAAVVLGAFPGITAQDAGNRLLSTATDLGAAGTDVIFGRGLLNLDNALTPQGSLQVATGSSVDGSKVAVSGSGLSLGSALSLDGAGADLLGKVVALDDDNFPFGVDLSGSAAVQSRSTGLASFIASDDRRTSVVSTDLAEVTLSVADDPLRDDRYRAEFARSDGALKAEAEAPRMQMRTEVASGVDLFFGLNGSSAAETGLTSALPAVGGLFQPSAYLAPFDQLSGEQSGGGTTLALGEDTALSVAAFTSAEDRTTRQSVLQKVELRHKAAGDVEFRFGYGFMEESGGYLGSEASGAFGADSGGRSHYVDASVVAPLSERLSLFGGYTLGSTAASGGGASLLSGYTRLRSEAFGAGLSMTDVMSAGDGLSLMVGQPLRVASGSAELAVPVGRTETGGVLKERGRVDLSPAGREIAFEAVYDFGLDDAAQSLTSGTFLRLNPDHDPDANPDIGIGLTYKINF